MYYESLMHLRQFEKAKHLFTDGQENERMASLYVFSSLSPVYLEKLLEKSYLDFYSFLEDESFSNSSYDEKAKIRLACCLYHGHALEESEHVNEETNRSTIRIQNASLTDFIGASNPLTPLLVQALSLHSSKEEELNSVFQNTVYIQK